LLLLPVLTLANALATNLPSTRLVYIGMPDAWGKEQTLRQWQPLADYLTKSVPNTEFQLKVLDIDGLEQAIAEKEIDFVFTNPSLYVLYTYRYGLSSPMATLVNKFGDQSTRDFAGVIFTRAERTDLQEPFDLKGKKIASVVASSLAAYQMQSFELLQVGVRLPDDAEMIFTGLPMPKVVNAVLTGEADAGFIRAGVIEVMEQRGQIPAGSMKIIGAMQYPDFPFTVSTRLYPEWPFAALGDVPDELSRKVANALISLPWESEVANKLQIVGFTVPGDYRVVDQLLRSLRLPPFDQEEELSIGELWQRWQLHILAVFSFIVVILISLVALKISYNRLRANMRLRKQVEAELRQAQEIALLGRWDYDHSSNRLRWSDTLFSIFETDKEQFGASFETFMAAVHPDDRAAVDDAWKKSLIDRQPYSIEHRLQMPDGRVKWLSEKCETVFDADNRPLHSTGIVQDITDRKKAENQIKNINQQLQKANAEKDMLFSTIAHDLKSPMSGLLASTELLAHQPDIFSEKEIRRLSTELHKNARNTFELMEDLLQWARMSQGGIDYAPKACSLNELLGMGLSTARDLAKHKEININLDIATDLIVLADQPMIKTVIRNILFNAIKFTPRGGEIVITARQEEQKVTVAVQDNGVGMNEQVMSSVFTLEKGKRQLGTEGEKGTGLGLMLCKQFIEQHGGEIWVESDPGKGTTVFFTLPTQETRTP